MDKVEKIFKPLIKENVKLKGLNSQLNEANNDFEDMRRTREEAKKQLEAKFLDIYKKIDNLKLGMEIESIRVNDSLKAFQAKFEFLLNELKDGIEKEMKDEKDFLRKKFSEHENAIEKLKSMINEEREERLKETDEKLNPLREQMEKLAKAQEEEKEKRKNNEKQLYRYIDDNVFELNEKLEKEADDRNTNLNSLKEEFKQELHVRDSQFGNFQKKMVNEIQVVKEEILNEMDNRFDHQNEIIDSISNFLKTFQDTLKVVGKEP